MVFTDQNFTTEVENNMGLILVDFYAPFCSPCQLMEPIINELIEAYQGKKIKIGKLNIDESGMSWRNTILWLCPPLFYLKTEK